jgi:hypothetical protein
MKRHTLLHPDDATQRIVFIPYPSGSVQIRREGQGPPSEQPVQKDRARALWADYVAQGWKPAEVR